MSALDTLLWIMDADNLAFTPNSEEAVTEVERYFVNDKGTPMVAAWTTGRQLVVLPQAFVEVGY